MSVTIHIGDCRNVLRTLPDESVHCVMTSPPYWGLRDYNIDGQLGLEATPDAYVAAMVEIFRQVRRVLRKDGTLWLNLGDSYASSNGINSMQPQRDNNGGLVNNRIESRGQQSWTAGSKSKGRYREYDGLKPKDLCGIPWRVAFALQADGWYLRQDIIWSKPNPMPESVTDRCTKAHEYIFLLSKSERYYYDQEAIKESGVNRASGTNHGAEGMCAGYDGHRTRSNLAKGIDAKEFRNRRSVWEVTTQPFSEAHFATFPPALIEPCIKAGTSEKGCCAKCGAPWVRQTERDQQPEAYPDSKYDRTDPLFATKRNLGGRYQAQLNANPIVTLGWLPSCPCNAGVVSGTVLDPFAGAGTTGLVADRLQRNAILIELNPEYAAMAERRIKDDAPLFVQLQQPNEYDGVDERWQ
jgi:DNA modification methylase